MVPARSLTYIASWISWFVPPGPQAHSGIQDSPKRTRRPMAVPQGNVDIPHRPDNCTPTSQSPHRYAQPPSIDLLTETITGCASKLRNKRRCLGGSTLVDRHRSAARRDRGDPVWYPDWRSGVILAGYLALYARASLRSPLIFTFLRFILRSPRGRLDGRCFAGFVTVDGVPGCSPHRVCGDHRTRHGEVPQRAILGFALLCRAVRDVVGCFGERT